ncbi:MAG: Gfo/Idh/MocA family oxidoreductase [Caldivirga sp.]
MGVKVALIGVGRIGSIHLKNLVRLRSEGLVDEITAVDADPSRLSEARSMGADETFDSIDAALIRHPEATVIATPTNTHYEVAFKLVGKSHLLVEKPATVTLSEAINLLNEAKKSGNLVIPAMVERFNETISEAINMVKEPIAISMVRVGPAPQNPTQYVGVIYDLAIHDLDLALMMTKPIKAMVSRTVINMYDSSILLDLDGVSVGIRSKWVNSGKMRVHVYISPGSLVVADLVNHVVYNNGEVKRVEQREEPIYLEDRNFIEAVMGKAKPFSTLLDHIKCLRIIEAAQRGIASVAL